MRMLTASPICCGPYPGRLGCPEKAKPGKLGHYHMKGLLLAALLRCIPCRVLRHHSSLMRVNLCARYKWLLVQTKAMPAI